LKAESRNTDPVCEIFAPFCGYNSGFFRIEQEKAETTEKWFSLFPPFSPVSLFGPAFLDLPNFSFQLFLIQLFPFGGRRTVTRLTRRTKVGALDFFFFRSPSCVELLVSLVSCSWVLLLACAAAATLVEVAAALVPRVDWAAAPPMETFWPRTEAVTPAPPEALTPPIPITVPEIVPAVAVTFARPPERSVPVKF
jgi:hypothetical protein